MVRRPAAFHSHSQSPLWLGVILVVIVVHAAGAKTTHSRPGPARSHTRQSMRRKNATGGDVADPPLPLFLPPWTISLKDATGSPSSP